MVRERRPQDRDLGAGPSPAAALPGRVVWRHSARDGHEDISSPSTIPHLTDAGCASRSTVLWLAGSCVNLRLKEHAVRDCRSGEHLDSPLTGSATIEPRPLDGKLERSGRSRWPTKLLQGMLQSQMLQG